MAFNLETVIELQSDYVNDNGPYAMSVMKMSWPLEKYLYNRQRIKHSS